MPFGDWTMRCERGSGDPVLRIYGETRETHGLESLADLAAQLDRSLREIDPLYRDLGAMLGIKPLRVSLLPAGSSISTMRSSGRLARR